MARKRGRPGRSERIIMQSGGPCGTGLRLRGGRTAEGEDPPFPWCARKYGAYCHEPWSAACVVLSLPPADPYAILRRGA